MKLHNEFEVAVPVERVWDTLIDIERVARFLPGATIEPTDDEGVYRGAMKVKLGPMVVNYQGTARLGAVDEQGRSADIEVEAKDARGQGTASAVIHNRLVSMNGKTRVVAETDLHITGRHAQFGRGIMQDVAGNMLGEFARRFERYLIEGERAAEPASDQAPSGEPAARSAPAAEPAGAEAADEPEGLDALSLLSGTKSLRRGAAAAGLLASALLVGVLRRRRSRGFEVRFGRTW
jgi:carbon monoxide dehydrogenase subunit G